MILFLYGKDTYRSRARLHAMVAKFRADRDPQGLNSAVLDAEQVDASAIWEQVLASPFLAEKRMVVVENLLIATKQGSFRKELLERIEGNMLPESTVLVFWEGTDTFKTKDAKELFSRLAAEKYAQEFSPISGVKLEAWIAEEVQARGGKISRDAARFLATNAGADMWRLNSLIDQLVSYTLESVTGDTKTYREITLKDVGEFVDEKVDDNIFNLVDAIVGKQGKKVFAMMREQYREGKDAGYIFAMILRQFRILLQLRDLSDRDDTLTSDTMAKRLSLHPFVVKKSLPIVKRYTMRELHGIYNELLDIDYQTKTGGGEQEMLLDVFVGRVCVA